MEKTEQYPIGKVEYSRFKESHSDKIIFNGKEYVVERTFRVKGYDALMHKWDTVKVYTKILPLSELPEKPSKVAELSIVILRETVNPQNLKMLKGYFLQKLKVSIKDMENNLFLVVVHGKVFMTDLSGKGHCNTAPIGTNTLLNPKYRPNTIKVEFEEAERISNEKASELLKSGLMLYEELELPDGTSEFAQLV